MQTYKATVKTKQRKNEVIQDNTANTLTIWTTALPQEGKANIAIIKQLSEHFHVNKSSIIIKTGTTSKTKIIVIN